MDIFDNYLWFCSIIIKIIAIILSVWYSFFILPLTAIYGYLWGVHLKNVHEGRPSIEYMGLYLTYPAAVGYFNPFNYYMLLILTYAYFTFQGWQKKINIFP